MLQLICPTCQVVVLASTEGDYRPSSWDSARQCLGCEQAAVQAAREAQA